MVQLFADPTLSQSGNPALETPAGRLESKAMSREEHAQRMRELNMKRAVMRAPRRGWSLTDYQAHHHDGHHHSHAATPQVDRIPENAAVESTQEQQPQQPQAAQLPRKLPPPRRSYSVTDCEPEPPNQPRPSSRLTLLDLPSELHYALFDFLDPIDGACLGLAHRRLYAIHRRKNGTVPLSSRYSGPNDMEWAWRGAGPLVHGVASQKQQQQQQQQQKQSDLDRLRVKGQMYCRKCGISRCELHRHLKDWIGEAYEYCDIKEVYGRPADPDTKPYCFMSSPKNPHRCGRHGAKKGAVAAVAAAATRPVDQHSC